MSIWTFLETWMELIVTNKSHKLGKRLADNWSTFKQPSEHQSFYMGGGECDGVVSGVDSVLGIKG